MKKLLILMLICVLLTSCANLPPDNGSSISGGSVDKSDEVSDEVSDESVDNGNRSPFDRVLQIELPENLTYSREIRKDYREFFAEYYELKTNENLCCFAWIEDSELKFGLSEQRSISDYGSMIKTMKAATLGEIRAVFSTGYTREMRQNISAVPLDDRLIDYVDELEYMLGIGEENIEFIITLGGFSYDIPIYGSEAEELYDLLEEMRETAKVASNDDMSDYKGDDVNIGISFAPTGTIDFGGVSDCGSYSITPDGYITYVRSLYSSTMFRYVTDEAFYKQLYDRVIALLNARGEKYPFFAKNEVWCTVKTGLHSNQRVITGTQAERLLETAKRLSDTITSPSGDFVPKEDSETAIYTVVYKGNERESEFVVYSDDYCIPLTPLSVSNRPRGILPKGSYQEYLELVLDEYAEYVCRASFGRHGYSYTEIKGKTAYELYGIIKDAHSESREANQKEILDHSSVHDSAVKPENEDKLIHLMFTSLPKDDSMLCPSYTVWEDDYCQWTPSSLASFMPKPIVLPDGSYASLYRILKEHIGETNGERVGVTEFLALAKEKGINIDENATVYNLTPQEVADNTDYRIFKEMTDFGSYVTVDGEIYELCNSFGGFGFHNASVCDFDNNGVLDLIVRSSWGSGMHRDEISVFNMTEKRYDVILSSIQSDVMPNGYYGSPLIFKRVSDENAAEYFEITAFKPTTESFVSSLDSVVVGRIVSIDGKPVFVKNDN